jgi:uncharacterized protein DUF6745
MSIKIESLTAKQTASMPAFRDKWIKIGLNNTPINHAEAKKAINAAYKAGGLKPPKSIQFVSSPMAMVKLGVALMGMPGDKSQQFTLLSQCCYGQQDASWLSFYAFFREKLGLKAETEKLSALIKAADVLHWWLPFDETCLVSERPLTQKIENGVLHCDTGPAIEYADGFSIYRMGGIEVPAWLANTPAKELDVAKVMALPNVDVRTAGIKKIGIANMRKHLDVKVLHTYEDYELWTIVINGNRVGPYLKMVGPTTGETHVECVAAREGQLDSTILTCQEALQIRRGLPKDTAYTAPDFSA